MVDPTLGQTVTAATGRADFKHIAHAHLHLADVAELVRVIKTKEFWRPLNDLKLLRRYERARQADVKAMGLVTDGLQRLFAQPSPLWQQLRNWGLSGFDHSGALKHWIARHAMGTTNGKTTS